MEIENDFENKVENAVKEILDNIKPLTDGTDFRDFLLNKLNNYDFLIDEKYKLFKNDLCIYLYDCILYKLIIEERERDPIKEFIEMVDN
jgi:hypothetical protein